MRRHGRGESGTTIVEVAVGLAVGALLVAGILVLVEQAQKSYMHTSEVTDLQQNVRVSMDRMVRIIQAAGVNPLNLPWGGATPNNVAFTAFREAGRNCIRVYADLNGDGDVQDAEENVYFHWPTTPATGAPIRETRGTVAGQPDAGQAWVAVSTGAEELARDIVANPGGWTCSGTSRESERPAGRAQHAADPAGSVHDDVREPVGRAARPGRPGGDHRDGPSHDRRRGPDQDRDVRRASAQRALKEEPGDA